MEMVDMVITKVWISGPKSRSVNISLSIQILGDFCRWIFCFEKMTFLDLYYMYLMIVNINNHNILLDLVNVWSIFGQYSSILIKSIPRSLKSCSKVEKARSNEGQQYSCFNISIPRLAPPHTLPSAPWLSHKLN